MFNLKNFLIENKLTKVSRIDEKIDEAQIKVGDLIDLHDNDDEWGEVFRIIGNKVYADMDYGNPYSGMDQKAIPKNKLVLSSKKLNGKPYWTLK